jgi:acyl-coenzyme A synthetase/AMP-(fatty) acid ligase/3-hydroxymyristoyl/3-hydroxydecanoyl-(acyl carrier protein) dehydratase
VNAAIRHDGALIASMLPLLRGFEPDRTLLFDRGEPITAAGFCAAAVGASARLPRVPLAFNLCEGRAEFLLASAAAWLAGQTLLLPPSRLARTLVDLRAMYPDSYCLVDTPLSADNPLAAIAHAVRTELDQALAAPPPATAWHSPDIPATHIAAILFTSGSTGAPRPHPKTWGEMCEGTQTLLRSFGVPSRGAAILATVPLQHMFGFETSVILSLQSGTPLLDARPVYPADFLHAVNAAAQCGVDDVWLMSTPLQLRAFHRDLSKLRGIRRIISATMPFPSDLARAIEDDWDVPVEEIFGCTEGGILAVRRPARSVYFSPAAGLVFKPSDDGTAQVSGGHLRTTLTLSDSLRPELPGFGGAGRFEVTGRLDDVQKIAGKRASLADLTRDLMAVPGVIDGAFFRPVPDAERLAAVVAAPGLGRDDIWTGLAGRIDPAFMPRPLVVVAALPRDANGKLPIGDLRALLPARRCAAPDIEADGDDAQAFTRECVVPIGHAALPGHFPGHPVVPGVVLLHLVEALLADNGYHVRACPQAKFLTPIAPAMPLTLRINVARRTEARFVIAVNGTDAVVGRFVCGHDGAHA